MAIEKKEKKEIKKKEIKNKENINKTDIRVYNILSYIGILWLVGLLGSDKDNASVRFHVGQGILVSIMWVVVNIINSLFIANIFRTNYILYGVYTSGVSIFGGFIMAILNCIPLVFAIIGIINAFNNKDVELPYIGKYSFYK